MEIDRTFVCPNCGASITNTQNCEYCGSLLVRFIDKGIDLQKTSYLDNSLVFDRLLSKLKLSLQLREQSSHFKPVALDIYKHPFTPICCILQSDNIVFSDDTPVPSNAYKGLFVMFSFDKLSMEELIKFRTLDCSLLFTERVSIVNTLGVQSMTTDYYIDFGNDAEGAARLLSDIFSKVYNITDKNLDCQVNVGLDDIKKSRIFYANRRPISRNKIGVIMALISAVTLIVVSIIALIEEMGVAIAGLLFGIILIFITLQNYGHLLKKDNDN